MRWFVRRRWLLKGDEKDEILSCAPYAPSQPRLDHIEQVLARLAAPIPRRELRRACRMRDSALGDALGQLLTAGRVVKSTAGYQLAPG